MTYHRKVKNEMKPLINILHAVKNKQTIALLHKCEALKRKMNIPLDSNYSNIIIFTQFLSALFITSRSALFRTQSGIMSYN